jgi:hypothetical protein
MTKDVHLALHGEQTGIVPMPIFLSKFQSGDFAPEIMAWTEGDSGWSPVAEFATKHAKEPQLAGAFGADVDVSMSTGPAIATRYFAELGADIEICTRRCVALPKKEWVSWDDGREEQFSLPLNVVAGHQIIILGVRAKPRVGAPLAKTRDGKPLFEVQEGQEFSWCVVVNESTGARWSGFEAWSNGLMNEEGRSAIEFAKSQNFDLTKARDNESRKGAYLTIATLLPPVVDIGLGALVWWVTSLFLPNTIAVGLGVVVGLVALVRDLRANIKNGIYDYETVKQKRHKDVHDGVVVRSVINGVEEFVNHSLTCASTRGPVAVSSS